jgi:hypothetical protein
MSGSRGRPEVRAGDPKGAPAFQIDRPSRIAECTYRAGTFSAVVPCPPTTKPISP